jgi:hypothetical protein
MFRLAFVLIGAAAIAVFPQGAGTVGAIAFVVFVVVAGLRLAFGPLPTLEPDESAPRGDALACHPCRGCGSPVYGRARYCGETCKAGARRAREAARWLETEQLDQGDEIPF